tara:strand:+ start:2319 stop:2582 length:264 start_codon:yes stop_codon:yes gene_type:complete
MKVIKELKNATFEYDEETKKFLISDHKEYGVVELNKVYAFAFMRFVIRMAQRNWLKQKKPNKAELNIAQNEDDHPDQIYFKEEFYEI